MALPSEPQVPIGKEKKEVLTKLSEKEKHDVVERLTVPEIPREIEGVESVASGEVSLPQLIADDQGLVIVDDSSPQQVTVTLPLTDEEQEQALHLKLVYSIRWLAERTKRLVKLSSQKFAYKLKPNS